MNTYCICVNYGYGFMRNFFFFYVKRLKKNALAEENEIHKHFFVVDEQTTEITGGFSFFHV